MLKNRQTDKVFAARQTHERINGDIVPSLQSQQQLVLGNSYETLRITSPAPQASNLRRPDQAAVVRSPSLGFAKGTHIMTEHGEIPIENLTPRIRLVTRDHGMQRLRWVGETRSRRPQASLVRFHAGAINNCRDLVVCANQLIVLKGPEAMMRFGQREVFVQAHRFVDDSTIVFADPAPQSFYQLLLDNHEVIYAEAAACESFLPTPVNMAVLSLAARLDIHLMRPDIKEGPGPLARSHVTCDY
ncbi:MAG: Hint domain-containing protein [Rhodobacteraceae bacterium]|nr:Hint domain-containing protein [Paracoccaceae bacterium]